MHKGDVQKRCQEVSNNQDGQIRRAIIRTLVAEVLFADRAMVTHLEIAGKQRASATVGALAIPAAFEGSLGVTLGINSSVGKGSGHGSQAQSTLSLFALSRWLRKPRVKRAQIALRRHVAKHWTGPA